MLHRCYIGVTVAAIGSMLLAGCATAPQSGSSRANPVHEEAASSREVDSAMVSAHAHYALGLMHDLDGDAELALQELSLAAQFDPSNEELVLDLSARYLKRKEPEQALSLLDRATALPGASGELFARKALVCSRLGKDADAIAAGKQAIKRAPALFAAYQNLFLVHVQKGRTKEAKAVLLDAARERDTSVEFLLGLADLYTILQRQAPSEKAAIQPSALEVIQRAASTKPTVPIQLLKLADDYSTFGDATNAAKIYLELLSRYPDAAPLAEEVRPKLANIYLQNKDSKKATEQLEALIKDDPANAQAYYFLGSLAYDAKKLPEAEDYFKKALLLREDLEPAYYDLALVQINLDRDKDAIATLDRAQPKFHDTFTSEFLRGLVCAGQKDFTNALTHLNTAESIAKTSQPSRLNEHFYFQMGSAYEREGDYDSAEKYFEKSLELQPEFAEALNYYGYMLADRGMKLEKARGLIEKAVKLEPDNAAYIDSLGWVYYKLNEPRQALDQILKAIKLTEKPDATLFDHLGDVYVALKEPDKARDAWQKSLSVEANMEVKKKLGAVETR